MPRLSKYAVLCTVGCGYGFLSVHGFIRSGSHLSVYGLSIIDNRSALLALLDAAQSCGVRHKSTLWHRYLANFNS